MRCAECHKENNESDLFCVKCGTEIPSSREKNISHIVEQLEHISNQVNILSREVTKLQNTSTKKGNSSDSLGGEVVHQVKSEPSVTTHSEKASQNISIGLPDRFNWETILGGNWLVRAGMLAILIHEYQTTVI